MIGSSSSSCWFDWFNVLIWVIDWSGFIVRTRLAGSICLIKSDWFDWLIILVCWIHVINLSGLIGWSGLIAWTCLIGSIDWFVGWLAIIFSFKDIS